ncbi:hypothetical protein LWI28_012118 [Acer negundo]|uniref:Uncharacterized protein n=1 Tax=Acer negundo TaxID=4023 RepID=A0AAD5J5X1_ACENE|nr:hypothetical protein LWI28_012118 [Acer negundo]
MEPFPNATKMYSLVRQEEKQQEIQSLPSLIPKSAALNATRYDGRTNIPSNRSGKGGNRQWGSDFDNRRMYKPRPHCDYCDRDGHMRATCYKLHGFPPKQIESLGHQANQATSTLLTDEKSTTTGPFITKEQYNILLAMLSSGSVNSNANLAGIALSVPSHSSWIIDTVFCNKQFGNWNIKEYSFYFSSSKSFSIIICRGKIYDVIVLEIQHINQISCKIRTPAISNLCIASLQCFNVGYSSFELFHREYAG